MGNRRHANQWPFPRYKGFQEDIRRAAISWFDTHGVQVNRRQPFILAHRDDWVNNIIVPEVATYIENELKSHPEFQLHKYIHHGLSSQALLFNLIGPLVVSNDFEPLFTLFQHAPVNQLSAEFEYNDRSIFNEVNGHPTSIDLLLRDNGKPLYCIEAKFSEKEFGGCSIFTQGDCDGQTPAADFDRCYLHFIGRRYWELLEKHGFVAGKMQRNEFCVLSMHYQFFRELLFALESDSLFILLYDSRNPTFQSEKSQGRGLIPFLRTFIPEQHQHRFMSITIQEVAAAIKKTQRHPWITQFEAKYGLI